ncbi:UNVERIFIED_CONTAM: hypothetical protein K2H54_045817 [Gekko kuhli]
MSGRSRLGQFLIGVSFCCCRYSFLLAVLISPSKENQVPELPAFHRRLQTCRKRRTPQLLISPGEAEDAGGKRFLLSVTLLNMNGQGHAEYNKTGPLPCGPAQISARSSPDRLGYTTMNLFVLLLLLLLFFRDFLFKKSFFPL